MFTAHLRRSLALFEILQCSAVVAMQGGAGWGAVLCNFVSRELTLNVPLTEFYWVEYELSASPDETVQATLFERFINVKADLTCREAEAAVVHRVFGTAIGRGRQCARSYFMENRPGAWRSPPPPTFLTRPNQVAHHCKQLCNFFSLFTILGALDTPSIRK